ncbi:MAG: RNA polymerase sigma factor [Candidatus Sumerlaeaceae bacterium]
MSASTPAPPAGLFVTTHWSLIVSAGQPDDTASRQALETLCAKYWPALYGYVRRRGHSVEDAHDLTQEFFVRLLERNWIARAEQSKGRFRSFMLTVLKRFLADEWDRERTQKRGGNLHFESLSEVAESVYASRSTSTHAPELEFERDWAMALLKHVLEELEQEYTRAGKAELFAVLRHYLTATGDHQPQAEVAAALGMTQGAFRVAVSRIRQRYRDKMREEVAGTLADPRDIESELRHLFRILAKTH